MLKSVLDSKAYKFRMLVTNAESLEKSNDIIQLTKVKQKIMDMICWFDDCGYLNALNSWCNMFLLSGIKFINLYSVTKMVDKINLSKDNVSKFTDQEDYKVVDELQSISKSFKIPLKDLIIWNYNHDIESNLLFDLSVRTGDSFNGRYVSVILRNLNKYFINKK